MDDLRQAAIEYFQRIIDATNTDGRYNLGFIDGLEFCINHLSTMPSAQPEQKKGKWIEKTHTYEFFEPIPLCVCSECGRTIKYREKYKYCPNCGAEMEGEE